MIGRGSFTKRGAVASLATLMAGLALSATSDAATWSEPFEISGWQAGGHSAVAMSPARQDAVVTWQRGTDVFARRIAFDGTRGPIRLLGDGEEENVEPSVAVARSGAAVIVWNGSDNRLRARRLGLDDKLGPTRQLDPRPGVYVPFEARVAPRVAVDAAGNFTVVWSQNAVRARRFFATGKLGPLVNLPDGGRGQLPSLAVAPSGRATVAWAELDGASSTSRLRATTLDARGVVGPVRDVTPDPIWLGVPPALTLDGQGRATFVWSGAARMSIVARRMDADGTLQPTQEVYPGNGAVRVVSALNGRTTIVWRNVTSDSIRILGRQLDGNGVLGPLWDLGGPTVAPDSPPDVAVDPVGRVTVAWADQQGLGPDAPRSIRTRRITPDGKLASQAALTQQTSTFVSDPAVATGRNGVTVAIWSAAVRGGGAGIEAVRLVPRCPVVQVRRAAAYVLKNRRPPHAAGVHLNVVLNGPAVLRVAHPHMSFVGPMGAHRTRRLLLPRRIDRTTKRQHLLIGVPRKLRARLARGQRVTVRVPLRTKPYATGCDFGRSHVVRVSARVQ
jgi:hypothetical protein